MKWTILCAAAAAFLEASGANAAPPAFAGRWTGTMISQGQPLPVTFDLRAGTGRFTSPTQAVMDYPLDRLDEKGDQLSFVVGGGLSFDGHISGDTIAGTFKSDSASGTFTLHRAAVAPLPYAVRDVAFRNGSVVLHGTICLPKSGGRHPGVVLIHGSGPQTRWGTMRYVADRFARSGVAVLIYDKRGSGESGGDWRTSRHEDLARDALAAVSTLASSPGVDPRRIGLLGHSQGGVIAPLAAKLAPGRIAFIVAEDTFAGPQWQQDIYRVQNLLKTLDLSAADYATAMQVYTAFVDAARGALPYEEFERRAKPYRETSWYKWMAFPPRESWVWPWAAANGNFDPLPLWREVRVPVLLVYGEKDMLQPRDETIAKIGGVLESTKTPYTALIVPDTQHNLTVQPEDGQPFFWWHQAPGLIETVVAWVQHETRS